MVRLARLGAAALSLARPWFAETASRQARRAARRRARRFYRRVRLEIEVLESRTLLSASILGSVWNDLNGDGLRQAGEPGLAGQVVYLDLNHDGKLDSTVTPVNAPSPTVTNQTGTALDSLLPLVGGYGSALQVQGLPSTFQSVAVSLDLTNNSPDPILVNLVSPLGLTIPNLPLLFNIQPGQTFTGTLDSNAPNPITLAPNLTQPDSVLTGTYAPQQSFASPQFGIDSSSADGTWGLVFYGGSASDLKSLDLRSWSLSFTLAEPSTTTDAAGNYAFTGLAPGTYPVALAHSPAGRVTAPAGAAQTATVADGQTASGVNFGVQPAPDLTAVSFALASPATAWGQPVTVNYTLTNQGAGDAPAFDVGLYLSANGVISTGGPLLGTLHFAGLAAGASISGSTTVPLPAGPPAGFDSLSTAYAGFVIDPANAVPDADRANNSNQGAGIDLALLGARANVPVAAGAGVQQAPAVAVDPANPAHLVVAYMDYSLLKSGYAGIGIAVSQDGGKNWSNTSLLPPAPFDQGAAAPAVAFDAAGNVYVSFMAATFLGAQPALTNPDSTQRKDGFQASNGIFVARSSDGGRTWGAPVAVASNVFTPGGTPVPFEAFPSLAVDTFPTLPGGGANPYFGSVYVTWTQFYPPGQFPGSSSPTDAGSDVMLAVSADGGASFTTQMQDVTEGYYLNPPSSPGAGSGRVSALKDQQFGNNPGILPRTSTVTVGPGGAVFVSAFIGGEFTVFSSTDGGRSVSTPGGLVSGFAAPNWVTQQGFPFGEGILVLTDATLDNFRTLPLRQIIADPSRPGVLYAVAPSFGLDEPAGNNPLSADGIVFAVSDDYGQSWASNFTVGSESPPLAGVPAGDLTNYIPVLNDDNGGQYAGFAASLQNQVVDGQAIPSIAVDAQGNITVIWYDNRSDPTGQDIGVWGTTSTDGGRHFTANFPVTDSSFDPNAGAFTAGNGAASYYLGDQIGLAAANGTAYAVWTDTRNGNQDVYFGSYALSPAPAPPADRFGPNDTPQTATNLGQVAAQQVVPQLTLPPGSSNEWFSLQAGASGKLSVSIAAASGGADLRLALTDAGGHELPATVTDVLDSSGTVTGKELVFPSTAGQTYLIHVSAQSAAAISYTLTAEALTADLGTQVAGSQGDTLAAGAQDEYRLTVAVTGVLQVAVQAGTVQGSGLNVKILTPDGQKIPTGNLAPLTSTDPVAQFSLPVTQGEVLLLQVSAVDATSSGSFTLRFTNLDQYEIAGARGTEIEGSISDARVAAPGLPNQDYAVTAGVGGTLQVTITASGNFSGNLKVRVINGDKTALLAGSVLVPSGATAQLLVPSVAPGQTVFVRVSGVGLSSGDQADYTLQLSNLDPAASSGLTTLFFPTVGDPSSIAAADLAGNGKTDLLVTNTDASDTLGVLRGNGNGTFQAEQQFDVGPGLGGAGLTAGNRQIAVARLNADGTPDVIVPNFRAGDVSVLPGNGDGTFQPQRIFDAVANPDSVVTGDFNHDGNTDAVVLQNFAQGGGPSEFAVLLGRGDGTFLPPVLYPTIFTNGAGPMVVGDFNHDGHLDLIIFSKNASVAQIFFGNGDGTFRDGGVFSTGEDTFNAAAVDLTGDGNLDLVTTGTNTGDVYVMLGNGDGTFQAPVAYPALAPSPGETVGVFGLAVTDFGNSSPGAPLNIVVTAASRTGTGPAEVIMLPGLGNGQFGTPVVLATVATAGQIAVGDFTGDGTTDLAVADKGGITVIYGKPETVAPNTTPAAARNLGNAPHLATLTQAVVPGFEDAYYTYTAPAEAAPGAGAQVVDISARFSFVGGAGLTLEVLDAHGNPLPAGSILQESQDASGVRVRVLAAQGQVLLLHVAGLSGGGGTRGWGAYTLDVDVLPQVVSVQAESPLPGGPATSLVLTLQGDRLDPAAAQDPANYTVTWFGGNGTSGPVQTQALHPSSVVYDPGANIDVASGLTFPTAVRQTITLLFDQPLAAGSYQINLTPSVQAAALNGTEANLLVGGAAFAGHPVVLVANGQLTNGSTALVTNVAGPGVTSTLIASGTPFLTQFHDDLGALLDALIAQNGDDPAITAALNQQILARFEPGVDPSSVSVAVIWLDPVSIDLADSQGARTVYNLKTNAVSNGSARTFMEAGGNVEVMVLAGLTGTMTLNIADVQPSARGGAVLFGADGVQMVALTESIRDGARSFKFELPNNPGSEGGGGGGGSGSGSGTTVAKEGGQGPVISGEGPGLTGTLTAIQATFTLFVVSLAFQPGAEANAGLAAEGGVEQVGLVYNTTQVVYEPGVGDDVPQGTALSLDSAPRVLLEGALQLWIDYGMDILGDPLPLVDKVLEALRQALHAGQGKGGKKNAAAPARPEDAQGQQKEEALAGPDLQPLWLDEGPAEVVSHRTEGEPAETLLGDRSPTRLPAFLGLAALAAGLWRPPQDEEEEKSDRKAFRPRVRPLSAGESGR